MNTDPNKKILKKPQGLLIPLHVELAGSTPRETSAAF